MALEAAYTAALTSESAHVAKARAKRLRIVLAPFWEYLAQQDELPLVQARSSGGEGSAAAPSDMASLAGDAREGEYDLDEGISGFAGGISDD